jgi:polysaccharide pyruvyl transferase WcaK-like protein
MNIELRMVSHKNKGAELMLRSMLAHFDGRDDVSFTGRKNIGSRDRRRALGIDTLLFGTHRGHFVTTPRHLPPAALRRKLKLTHPSEVDLVLDAAGFAYGDNWPASRARLSAEYYKSLRSRGAKVILMPQSFGPFTRADVRDAARDLLGQADLIFPRDDTAMQAVEALVGPADHILQSPDFTPLIHGELPEGLALPERAAAVIPNQKMIQMAAISPDAYEAFLVKIIELFTEHGLSPFLLPHASQDAPLIERVKARTRLNVPVVIEHDALKLKAIIRECHMTMCSRFHGLVSALSQGVPAISTGWSHKYRHLLEEYEYPESLFELNGDLTGLEDRITAMLEPSSYQGLRTKLSKQAESHRTKAEQMWSRIDQLIAN